MLLKDLVLNSLEPIGNFAIQKRTENGGIKEERLTDETYRKFTNCIVQSYFLDVNKGNNQPYISVNLEDY